VGHSIVIVLAVASLVSGRAWARPGDVDATFGTYAGFSDGKSALAVTGSATHIAVRSDGGLVVAPFLNRFGFDAPIAQYLPNGSLDPRFGAGGIAWQPKLPIGHYVPLAAISIAPQADGGVLEVVNDGEVIRHRPDGTIDETFGQDGRIDEGPTVRYGRLAALPNGGFLALGSRFGRYSDDGMRDMSFGDQGVASAGLRDTSAVAVTSDAFVVAGGTVDGEPAVVRMTSAGQIDTSFGNQGAFVFAGRQAPIIGLVLQPDGAVVVGFSDPVIDVARLTADGTLDLAFGSDGFVEIPGPTVAIADDAQGRIVTGGSSPIYLGGGVLSRLTPDGVLDDEFGVAGAVHTDYPIVSVAVQPSGRIVAGYESSISFIYRLDGFVGDTRCGNGVVEPGEACDDGNTVDGDCCSVTCTSVEPDGAACDDAGRCVSDGACRAGLCDGVACGVCGRCVPDVGCLVAPQPACDNGRRSTLVLNDGVAARPDKLTWKLESGRLYEIEDPNQGAAHRVCVFDAAGHILLAAEIPPAGTCGAVPCWSSRRDPRGVLAGLYTYKDRTGSADGIQTASLDAGLRDARGRFKVTGKGPHLSVSTLAGVSAPIRAELHGDGGYCVGAEFTSDDVVRNDGKTLKAKH
jgi:uncharacterized delta-60 repeat protein